MVKCRTYFASKACHFLNTDCMICIKCTMHINLLTFIICEMNTCESHGNSCKQGWPISSWPPSCAPVPVLEMPTCSLTPCIWVSCFCFWLCVVAFIKPVVSPCWFFSFKSWRRIITPCLIFSMSWLIFLQIWVLETHINSLRNARREFTHASAVRGKAWPSWLLAPAGWARLGDAGS